MGGDEEKRKRGRPATGATVKCTVMLEPDMYEWGVKRRWGLAETIRRALRIYREEEDEKTIKTLTTDEVERAAQRLAQLPRDEQYIIAEMLRTLTRLNKPHRLEGRIVLKDGSNSAITFMVTSEGPEDVGSQSQGVDDLVEGA